MGKNPTFFRSMHWVFGFNARNLVFANKTMVLFQHLAIGTNIGGHWALCPIISTYL